MSPVVVNLALDVPLDRLFDYLGEAGHVRVGDRVVVPFGRKRVVGIVVSLSNTSEYPLEKLKKIETVFSDEPSLDSHFFKLLQFSAHYYQYPFGQAILNALPARMRQLTPASGEYTHHYVLNERGQLLDDQQIPARQQVLRKILAAFRLSNTLTPEQLAQLSPSWRKAILWLQEADYVDTHTVLAGIAPPKLPTDSPKLNSDQKHAVEALIHAPLQFSPFLVHGITGSGKTEVYMQMLRGRLRDDSGQALILVPEINLTPQLEQRFRERLPEYPLVTLHSNLSESERLQHWRLAQLGKARIVIGTRLSIFCPMPNLQLIIVDEEHDSSYKQQDSMRYHARDVAMVRAQQLQIPIVLGSATPALETWQHARSGKYSLLSLQHRAVSTSRLPALRCINMQQDSGVHGISQTLIKAIQSRLERGEQSLLFINRRGFAPVLLCNACHWIAPCHRCAARLVVHLRQKRLRCHHCGHEQKIVLQCPSCGNPDLHPTGLGTQRLEETLHTLFPNARIQRVDRDSTSRKDALQTILNAVHANEIDILVGTQMLAKGHDFPNLTLVGVIDTDGALYSPDFRASERLFAQLMQVAGRAGRAEKAGEVWIQTAFPEHPLFVALQQHDYIQHADTLLKERALAQFPPFRFLAILRAEASKMTDLNAFLAMAHQTLQHYLATVPTAAVQAFAPMPAFMEKLKGMERGQIVIQADSRGALQSLLRYCVADFRQAKLGQRVRWCVDVDPLEM